nr:ribbon-helix-helix protein, CopG family [Corynebacterium sp. ACRQJ]
MNGAVINLRIDDEQKRRLDRLSQRTGRPSSFYVREALGAHLAELEYLYALEDEAARIRRGEIETVSLTDLEAECDLGDWILSPRGQSIQETRQAE